MQVIADALLAVRELLFREARSDDGATRRAGQAADDHDGVGAVISLTYAAAIDDPARFKNSKQVGAHYGITPKRYQSGEIDYTGRISKIGDKSVRTALYQAAHIILTRPVKASALKSWAMQLAKRIGMAKAKVALARKLAVILHRMLVEERPHHKLPNQGGGMSAIAPTSQAGKPC